MYNGTATYVLVYDEGKYEISQINMASVIGQQMFALPYQPSPPLPHGTARDSCQEFNRNAKHQGARVLNSYFYIT